MTWNELAALINSIDEKNRVSYEQTRMIMHTLYQVNSTKQLKPTDVLKFSWDNEEDEIVETQKLLSFSDAEKLINNL